MSRNVTFTLILLLLSQLGVRAFAALVKPFDQGDKEVGNTPSKWILLSNGWRRTCSRRCGNRGNEESWKVAA
jgi:hypothetical protein